jgi:hypothetical protein
MNTNAWHGGGTFRSSNEAFVMKAERRECIVQQDKLINQQIGMN